MRLMSCNFYMSLYVYCSHVFYTWFLADIRRLDTACETVIFSTTRNGNPLAAIVTFADATPAWFFSRAKVFA